MNDKLALETRYLFSQLTALQREWQDAIGFGEEGHELRGEVATMSASVDRLSQIQNDINTDEAHAAADRLALAEANLRNYYIAKLALITTEVAEAIEELRHNRGITERYYSVHAVPSDVANIDVTFGANVVEQARAAGIPVKPEGVPSELADVVIRCLSLAGEIGLDLGAVIVEKLDYNATRPQRHGGKAI